MKMQRKLAALCNRFERVVGTLLIAGQLRQCLSRLSDHGIGRLMFQCVWNRLPLTSVELHIAMEATRRLLRSRRINGD